MPAEAKTTRTRRVQPEPSRKPVDRTMFSAFTESFAKTKKLASQYFGHAVVLTDIKVAIGSIEEGEVSIAIIVQDHESKSKNTYALKAGENTLDEPINIKASQLMEVWLETKGCKGRYFGVSCFINVV